MTKTKNAKFVILRMTKPTKEYEITIAQVFPVSEKEVEERLKWFKETTENSGDPYVDVYDYAAYKRVAT